MSDHRNVAKRYERLKRKGGLLEPPAGPRHAQLRPAFLGWQFRVSIYGLVWGPWIYIFGPRRRAERTLERCNPTQVEVLS